MFIPVPVQLVHQPPLITKQYSLMFPPANGCRLFYPTLLRHRNVINQPCSNVLGHTVVTPGGVLPSFLKSASARASRMGNNTIYRSVTKLSRHKSAALPSYLGSPTPAKCGVLCYKDWVFIPVPVQLVHQPPLITKQYSLMFPPANGCRLFYPTLLRHRNVINQPCSNVLGHTVVTPGGVLPSFLKSASARASRMGNNTIYRSVTKLSRHKSAALPSYLGSPTPAKCGVL